MRNVASNPKSMGRGESMRIAITFLVASALITGGSLGCQFLGGTAVGAGATSAGYEYKSHEQLEELEDDFEEGRISKKEYLERKEEIEDGSIVY
jgi:hypothetical protein